MMDRVERPTLGKWAPGPIAFTPARNQGQGSFERCLMETEPEVFTSPRDGENRSPKPNEW